MNRKRARENNINPKLNIPEFHSKLYLPKKRKTGFSTLKSNVIIDRITALEADLKLANEKITALQNENLSYNKKLYEIHAILEIPNPLYKNFQDTYIS